MGGQKGIPHRYHSKEFKLRAVQMVLSGKSAVEELSEVEQLRYELAKAEAV